MATITGDEFDNFLEGDAADDSIVGLGGDDTLYGRGGIDTLVGGDGEDRIASFNDTGADILDGGDGNDWLSVEDPNDRFGDTSGEIYTILGGAGDDRMDVLGIADIDGGDGVDTVNIHVPIAVYSGGETLDLRALDTGGTVNFASGLSITGVENGFIRFGANGDDVITMSDTLSIRMFTGGGDDLITGGAGRDIIVAGGRGRRDDDTIFGGGGDDYLSGGGNHSDQDLLRGEEGDDDIVGGRGNDVLYGDHGSDTIFGGSDDDTIYGGKGADTLQGGYGADVFVFGQNTVGDHVDTIVKFRSNDVIDLQAIDADVSQAGDQAFVMVDAFTGTAGELTLGQNNNVMFVKLDDDGDGRADMVIKLVRYSFPPDATDFIL